MTEPVILLDGVSVVFDARVTALRNLTWTVREGERWVVLGPNGSGKTTLVQLITGYLHPSSGDFALLGARLGHGVDWRVHRQRVAVVSAAFAKLFRPQLTAMEIVMTARHGALEPWWHDYTDADRGRARRLLDDAAYGYLADRPFAVCSEGERQQVQLARCLMGEPDLLVLDEACAGLDLGARERLIWRLGSVAVDPAASPIVLITHHVEEIPAGFTHALLLREGVAVAAGPIEVVLTSHHVSAAFDVKVSISVKEGRYACRIQ